MEWSFFIISLFFFFPPLSIMVAICKVMIRILFITKMEFVISQKEWYIIYCIRSYELISYFRVGLKK